MKFMCDAMNPSRAAKRRYIFIGIPLFGALMGFAADIYISRFQRRQVQDPMQIAAPTTLIAPQQNLMHGAPSRTAI